jgi:lysozyme
MKLSPNGLKLIKTFEGLRLTAYRDVVGVWTVGYGSTGPHVHEGLNITEEYAEELLLDDLERFEDGVEQAVTRPMTQGQFDALVSFSFNLGLGNLRQSTLLRKFNAGDIEGAAFEFKRWNRAGGREYNGLIRRRAAEEALFRGRRWEAA